MYNNRGWADGLFTDEERKLLQEKFNELNTKTRQRTDNVLGDGSRIVETNNSVYQRLLDFEKSETTSQQILAIIKDAKTQGKEQYYHSLSNLTDILNSSQNEQEIIKKLKEIYPQIVK